jgi:hypothetical protein
MRTRVRARVDLLLAAVWEATTWIRRVPDLPRAAEDVTSAVALWSERARRGARATRPHASSGVWDRGR